MSVVWVVPVLLAAVTLVVCVGAVASYGQPWFRTLALTGGLLAWGTTVLVTTILVTIAVGPSW